jgi:hypothetical protein
MRVGDAYITKAQGYSPALNCCTQLREIHSVSRHGA